MRVAIVGAGAIGGWLAGQLISGGEEPILVARGAALAAIAERGLAIRSPDNSSVVHPCLADDIAAVGESDVVFLAVKAHSLG